ncbi:MAG: ribonuclease P protein component [Candidatus Niyogibacteria bacterium]|nr:ribonuclease P protein component [Candidatus Niyogibacteria bacterium]
MALSRIHRLKDRTRIGRVLRFGRRASIAGMRISMAKSPDIHSHLAITVPKTIDKRSTVRNALRRRAAEILRPILPRLSPPADIVITLSPGAKALDSREFKQKLESLVYGRNF